MRLLLIISILLFFTACTKQNQTETYTNYSGEVKRFSYYPPGELKPETSGPGREDDNRIYAPDIRFPLESAPAYINSQVYGVGGMYGPNGSLCDQRNYKYPWNDNYCEKRSWSMPLCSGGKGHQGVDIRSSTCEKRKYYAVAVEDGIITYIGTYSISLRGNSGRTYRYMHLDGYTLQVSVGQKVSRGQRIGLVSDNMGGTSTSIHLHFDIRQTIKVGGESKQIFVPPYSSLVDAYKRLLQGRP
ncbi:M23 family metallopeptidase [bacterium]|nr:M23 family metallopeptidase [bacterium]MBU1958194.1 M23 family metallopeptidase [bacterium]